MDGCGGSVGMVKRRKVLNDERKEEREEEWLKREEEVECGRRWFDGEVEKEEEKASKTIFEWVFISSLALKKGRTKI